MKLRSFSLFDRRIEVMLHDAWTHNAARQLVQKKFFWIGTSYKTSNTYTAYRPWFKGFL